MPTQADLDANRFQYTLGDYVTSTPEGDVQAVSYTPRYLTDLLGLRQRVYSGEASPWERQNYAMQAEAARAIPTRDVSRLQAGHEGENALHGGSPDLGAVMLSLAERIESGKATDQERGLFERTYAMLAEQTYRATVPQESDAFNPLGDQFFGALGTIALGATGGLAGGALAGGGLGLAGTLGAAGTVAGTAGTGASVLGGAIEEPILQRAGMALGTLGAVAGGAGGLAQLWGTGVQSLSDAARLASSAGRITGAVGSASGNEGLSQAGRYLGQAGQLGQVGSGVLPTSVTDWSTQRGSPMDWDYWGSGDYPGDEVWAGGSPTFSESGGGWGYDPSTMQFQQNPLYEGGTPGGGGWGYDPSSGTFNQAPISEGDMRSGGGNWWQQALSTLGGAGRFLGQNANWLGPLAGAAGGVASGAIGSNAARNASGQQADALNRGIDLQTAQWLQQQERTAPWIGAGQRAVRNLEGMAGQPGPDIPGATPSIDRRSYGMPNAAPLWQPRAYNGPQAPNAADYRWNPGQGPQAADYRYTPGAIPSAANYRYTPGAVPTLSGQELLAQDPGVAFRLEQGRKALEASAAARGGLLSGPTMAALQRQGQEQSSQEYGNAWNRASQQAQLREGWAQTASQMGWGQAEAESRLREQVNQIASQQGWTQAQAEAAFREELAGRSQGQNWTQARQGQETQWNQGLEAEKWRQMQEQLMSDQVYGRNWDQYKATIGMDQATNQTDYERQQALYKQRLAQHVLPWEQNATLSTIGGNMATNAGTQGQAATSGISRLLEALGTAEAEGTRGGANSWMNALQNVNAGFQGYNEDAESLRFLRSVIGSRNLNA